MNRPLAFFRWAAAPVIFAGLLLGACKPSGQTPVALDETTSGIVSRTGDVPMPAPAAPVGARPASSSEAEELRHGGSSYVSQNGQSAPDNSAVALPAFEGAPPGDASVPYPVPSASLLGGASDPTGVPATRNYSVPPPIPGASFSSSASSSGGQSEGASDFVGSSFGP